MNDLVYVGFNSQVAALNRDTGELAWQWKCPEGSGYTTVLLDGDRLIVSVEGYTYGLDPDTGYQLWYNELPGMGVGVASLASLRGGATGVIAQAAHRNAQQDTSSSVPGVQSAT